MESACFPHVLSLHTPAGPIWKLPLRKNSITSNKGQPAIVNKIQVTHSKRVSLRASIQSHYHAPFSLIYFHQEHFATSTGIQLRCLNNNSFLFTCFAPFWWGSNFSGVAQTDRTPQLPPGLPQMQPPKINSPGRVPGANLSKYLKHLSWLPSTWRSCSSLSPTLSPDIHWNEFLSYLSSLASIPRSWIQKRVKTPLI